MTGPRVLLLQLSERTSGKGNRYMSGWLGKASVVAFQAEEPDKFGNPVWDVFVSTPEPRPEQQQSKPEARQDGPAKPAARQRPEAVAQRSPAQHQGWRGSQYRRPANTRPGAPAADDGPFYDDDLVDFGRQG